MKQANRTPSRGSRSPVEPDVKSAEYQAQVVAWFLDSGKSIARVAAELGLEEAAVRSWVERASRQATSDLVPAEGGAPVEASASVEMAALRKAASEAVARAEAAADRARA